jgi:hypothetical protein
MTRGTVINIHFHGALVRLEDGALAAVGAAELAAHRAAYVASLETRSPLEFVVQRRGRHPSVTLEPAVAHEPPPARTLLEIDSAFEERMDAYLKETEAWSPPDQAPPAERHFIRKKRRAAFFEARGKPT